MKRSEMVKSISEMIREYETMNKNLHRPTYNQFATALLNNLELMGMKPPDNGKGKHVATEYVMGHFDWSKKSIYEWDKE